MPHTARKARKKYPTLDWVKQCTLAMTQDRVMKVPKMESRKVPKMSPRFQR
jgi:hypothetical protein